jgi:hypothetical protein
MFSGFVGLIVSRIDLVNNDCKCIYEIGLDAIKNRVKLMEHLVHNGVLPLLDGFRKQNDVSNECNNACEEGHG